MSSPISTAVTYSSRCAHSLLRILRQTLERRYRPSLPNPVLLFSFAPSSTTPPEVLSHITSTLTQLYPEHVGCISAPLPPQYLHPRMRSKPHSCFLAYAFVNGVSFRSAIPGRAEVQVGRWHAARERNNDDRKRIRVDAEHARMRALTDFSESDGKVDWDHVWDHSNVTSVTSSLSSRHGSGPDLEALPDALLNVDPSAVNNIFYFSDKAPEGLERVLQYAFPTANKLSLVASSTPFITGRPVTLFHNGSILSNGAVGIALTSSPLSPPPAVELSFPPLVALSRNLNVTSSKGNLILSLDSGNPTQLLLNAIRKHGLSPSHTKVIGKEDEFYVGVIDSSSQEISQLHRINAGDPSRGGIALDGASAPGQGSIVGLYYLPNASTYIPDIIPNSISLFVAPEMTPTTSFVDEITDDLAEDGDHLIVSHAFLAASENGFTLSRGTQTPWKCVVPGGHMRLSSY